MNNRSEQAQNGDGSILCTGVERVAEAKLPTEYGEFRIIAFKSTEVEGEPESKKFIRMIRHKATNGELCHLYIIIF